MTSTATPRSGTFVGARALLCALVGLLSLPTSASATEPAGAQVQAAVPTTVHVVVLKYFPVTGDGQNIDIDVTGDVDGPLADLQARVIGMTAGVANALSDGSTYRGYADSSAEPGVQYSIVDTIEIHTPVPSVPSTLNPDYPKRADYASIMDSLSICDRVTDQHIDQVWIWAYQGPHQLDISESKMSGPHGDISNSYRLDDMPHCGRTYTVYTYNYGRGTAEAIHNHGHQLEAELAAIDAHMFYDLFEGTEPHPSGIATGRCGSVHNPPNAAFEYDWANADPNPSDCLDWDPDGLGTTTQLSCSTWGCADHGDLDNPQRNWIVFWMQNLPGAGNPITFGGRQLRDWWTVHTDFDTTMESCRTLVLPCPDPFSDIAGSTFHDDILWLKASGITKGCTATKFCPNDPVTRAQMASFLARALGLPSTATDYFTDDQGNTHEVDINRLRKAGITAGCTATKFCPNDPVTRGQMAAFLHRALD